MTISQSSSRANKAFPFPTFPIEILTLLPHPRENEAWLLLITFCQLRLCCQVFVPIFCSPASLLQHLVPWPNIYILDVPRWLFRCAVQLHEGGHAHNIIQ